jgi:hypothetical protein
MEALITADPKSPLIPKLAKGLLERRRNGRWENTQTNCWATLAFDKYYHLMESDKVDLTVRMWVSDRYCGEAKVKGQSLDSKEISIPMSFVFDPNVVPAPVDKTPSTELLIQKEGSGRLYPHL